MQNVMSSSDTLRTHPAPATPETRQWRWWDIPAIIVLMVVALIAVVAALTAGLMVSGGIDASDPNGLMSNVIFTGGILIGQAAAMTGAVLLGMLWRRMRPVDLGLDTGTFTWRLALIALGVAVLLRVAVIPLGFVFQWLGYTENPQLPMLAPQGFDVTSMIITLIGGGILAPIGEELLFRGVIHHWLRRWGAVLAVVVSSLIFGLAHFNLMIGAIAFILGIGCAIIYDRTRSLWAPIIVHVVFNLLGIGLLYAMLAAGVEMPGVK